MDLKFDKKYVLGASLVLGGAILFSAKAVFIKLAYRHPVDSISLLTLRMAFALPFYLAINAYHSVRQNRSKIGSKDYLSIIGLGILGYYLASFFDFYGLVFITASLERLILFVYPTLVVLIGAIVYGRKITSIQWIAIGLTYAGLVVIVFDDLGMNEQKDIVLGGILIFMSALTYAIYLVGSGQIIPRLGSVRFTALAMTVSGISVIIHFLATHEIATLFNHVPEVYWISVMIAFFCTVIPSFMVSQGIALIGSSNASIIGGIGPVSTIVLAFIFLDERISVIQILGTLVVISAVLLISLKKESGPKVAKG